MKKSTLIAIASVAILTSSCGLILESILGGSDDSCNCSVEADERGIYDNGRSYVKRVEVWSGSASGDNDIANLKSECQAMADHYVFDGGYCHCD